MGSVPLIAMGMLASGLLLCYCERQLVEHWTGARGTNIQVNRFYAGVLRAARTGRRRTRRARASRRRRGRESSRGVPRVGLVRVCAQTHRNAAAKPRR